MKLLPLLGILASLPIGRPITVTATAFCRCKICTGPHGKGITFTGKRVRVGMIAVGDRRWLGRRVTLLSTRGFPQRYVRSYKAEDTGAFSGRRIDIYVRSHREALRFGRRLVKVRIGK